MGTFTRSVRLSALLSALALGAVGACAGDTAIVLVISAGDPATADTQTLEVFVGVGRAASPAEAAAAVWWRRAPLILADGAPAFPDGLGAQRYELALTPSDALPLDEELVFAVAARDAGGALIGFAHASEPLRFGDGQIRRVAVPLSAAASDVGVTDTGCAWWTVSPAVPPTQAARDRAIVPGDDADCDDFRAPADGVDPDCNPNLDCDDADPSRNPGHAPDCSDIDVDCCSTRVGDAVDADGDGFRVCDGDCVDSGTLLDVFGEPVEARDIHPGQADALCDGVDQACRSTATATVCDQDVVDRDLDGYVTCRRSGETAAIKPAVCGWFPGQLDCLEEGAARATDGTLIPADAIHPTADDVACDGVDQDCSGECDDGGPEDGDGDGYDRCMASGNVAADLVSCPASNDVVDCDDMMPFARPEPVIERCDGIDSGCDGVPAEPLTGAGPCLPVVTAAGQPCVIGRGQCAEQFDGIPRRSCDVSAPLTGPLPDALCAPCPGGREPLTCDDGRFQTCAAYTPTGDPGMACSDPVQVTSTLPACLSLACTWQVLGGTDVMGWSVGLVDPLAPLATPATADRTALAAALRVYRVGPLPRTVIVRRTDAGEQHYAFVRLIPPPTDRCAPMSCLIAATPGS